MKFKSMFDELLATQSNPRKHSQDEEHHIQCACVRWFRYQYPHLRHNLFAVPNGGYRNKATAGKMKEEGVLAGVADLILLLPNRTCHALCIEMKTRTGRQAETQREWQRLIEQDGYKYVVCRSIEDFMAVIQEYLK